MGFNREDLVKLVSGTVAFSVFFVIVCVCTVVFIPEDKGNHEVIPLESYYEVAQDQKVSYENLFEEEYPELVIENKKKKTRDLFFTASLRAAPQLNGITAVLSTTVRFLRRYFSMRTNTAFRFHLHLHWHIQKANSGSMPCTRTQTEASTADFSS